MDQLYRQTLELERRVKQYADEPNNGAVQRLWNDVHQLGEEMQMKKDPQTLEVRVKNIQASLQNLRSQQLFTPSDLDDLYDRSQDIREKLRDLG